MPCKIVGIIADTDGSGITGKLKITLNAPLIDLTTTPDTVRYMKPDVYDVNNGNLANVSQNSVAIPGGIVLQPTNEPTYRFEYTYPSTVKVFYLADGSEYKGAVHLHTDSKYYTGEIHSSQSQLLTPFDRQEWVNLFEPFNAGIPDIAQIEWSALQHSSVNASNVDTSLYYVAQLMTQGTLLQAILGGIYTPKGDWDINTIYNRGDVVYYAPSKGSYWYVSYAPSAGNLPTNQQFWMKVVEGTEISGGSIDPTTVLLNQAFGLTWDNVTNKAPTADVLYDQLSKYALLADATFQSLKAPTRAVGTNTTDVATMAALQAALAAFTPPASTTAPNLPSITPIPVSGGDATKIVNAYSLGIILKRYAKIQEETTPGSNGGIGGATNLRYLEFVKANAVNNLTGTENILEPSPPYAELKAGTYIVKGRAASCGTDGTRLNVVDSAGNILIYGESAHTGLTGYQIGYIGNTWTEVTGKISLGSTTRIGLRHLFQTSGNSADKGKASGRGGNEIFATLEVWKID